MKLVVITCYRLDGRELEKFSVLRGPIASNIISGIVCGGPLVVPSFRRLEHPVVGRLIPWRRAIAFRLKICHNTCDL